VSRTALPGYGIDGGACKNAALKEVLDVPWSEPVLFREVGVELAEYTILGLVCKLGSSSFDKEADLDPESEVR
jgi:hypothetical protein